MSALVAAVASVLSSLAAHLPHFPVISGIAAYIPVVQGVLRVANAFLPVSTAMQIFALVLAVWLVLIAWYWLAYVIAQIRGSSG